MIDTQWIVPLLTNDQNLQHRCLGFSGIALNLYATICRLFVRNDAFRVLPLQLRINSAIHLVFSVPLPTFRTVVLASLFLVVYFHFIFIILPDIIFHFQTRFFNFFPSPGPFFYDHYSFLLFLYNFLVQTPFSFSRRGLLLSSLHISFIIYNFLAQTSFIFQASLLITYFATHHHSPSHH